MNIKIGTRNSPLAIWQAKDVAEKLKNLHLNTEIMPIVSSGDKNLAQPLYAMGITGVFTKDLDIALLNKEIDIAVHSLKDVPTQLPENLVVLAYLERDFPQDVLVRGSHAKHKNIADLKIATSSLRRRAFWASKFPNTEFVNIRGNVNTRLQKIEDGLADATLFSLAGIKRLNLDIDYEEIPFMVSAPSQGVVVVVGHIDNIEVNNKIKKINHLSTNKCVETERVFLQTLEGGCTAPIGAFATLSENKMNFKGIICSLDGKKCIEINESFTFDENKNYGQIFAKKVLEQGGKSIMDSLK